MALRLILQTASRNPCAYIDYVFKRTEELSGDLLIEHDFTRLKYKDARVW